MFTFIKKLFGFDQATMKDAGVQVEQAPYKVEAAPVAESTPIIVVETPAPVNPQITDAVTQAPAKKPRKPRAPKAPVAENPAVKKAAPVKKAAAIKAAPKARTPRSKKV